MNHPPLHPATSASLSSIHSAAKSYGIPLPNIHGGSNGTNNGNGSAFSLGGGGTRKPASRSHSRISGARSSSSGGGSSAPVAGDGGGGGDAFGNSKSTTTNAGPRKPLSPYATRITQPHVHIKKRTAASTGASSNGGSHKVKAASVITAREAMTKTPTPGAGSAPRLGSDLGLKGHAGSLNGSSSVPPPPRPRPGSSSVSSVLLEKNGNRAGASPTVGATAAAGTSRVGGSTNAPGTYLNVINNISSTNNKHPQIGASLGSSVLPGGPASAQHQFSFMTPSNLSLKEQLQQIESQIVSLQHFFTDRPLNAKGRVGNGGTGVHKHNPLDGTGGGNGNGRRHHPLR